MGFFNKISKTDSLLQALAKKSDQSDISDKTVNKLSGIITRSPLQKQWDAYDRVKKMSDGTVKEKMLNTFSSALLPSSHTRIKMGLAENFQHDTEINFIDEIYIPQIIKSINAKREGANLRYFDDLPDFFNTALNSGIGKNAQVVVRMKLKNDKAQIHYCAADYIFNNGVHYFMFYEPAALSESGEGGCDYGFRDMKKCFIDHKKKYEDRIRVAFIEMNIQSSPGDCGMFSLALANSISKRPIARNEFLKKIKPFTVNGFYQSSSHKRIINTAKKEAILFPLDYVKHSNSISALAALAKENTAVKTALVNKKGETLMERAERHRVHREGASYSNSIEEKRGYFFRKHVLGKNS